MQDGFVNEMGCLITKKRMVFVNIFLSLLGHYWAKTITMSWHTDHSSFITIHEQNGIFEIFNTKKWYFRDPIEQKIENPHTKNDIF